MRNHTIRPCLPMDEKLILWWSRFGIIRNTCNSISLFEASLPDNFVNDWGSCSCYLGSTQAMDFTFLIKNLELMVFTFLLFFNIFLSSFDIFRIHPNLIRFYHIINRSIPEFLLDKFRTIKVVDFVFFNDIHKIYELCQWNPLTTTFHIIWATSIHLPQNQVTNRTMTFWNSCDLLASNLLNLISILGSFSPSWEITFFKSGIMKLFLPFSDGNLPLSIVSIELIFLFHWNYIAIKFSLLG